MECESDLALKAVLIGLRRSGAIDKRAVRAIVETLQESSSKVRGECPESADGLERLARVLADGPARSCTVAASG
jgi:hypothetical protein